MKKRENPSAKPYMVPALERGMRILELLSEHPAGLAMSDMAPLGLPAASLYRMLATLAELGYVVRGEQDRYRLGRKLLHQLLLCVVERILQRDRLAVNIDLFIMFRNKSYHIPFSVLYCIIFLVGNASLSIQIYAKSENFYPSFLGFSPGILPSFVVELSFH